MEWLRKAAKDRLAQLRASDASARLAEAQLALAREHGFPSWRKLKAHVDAIAAGAATGPAADREDLVRVFLERVAAGDLDRVRAMLDAAPWLVNAAGPHPFWGGRPQPLHVAIEGKRADLFDLLLERGADVSGANDAYDHWSPLMLAINRQQPGMRDELLRRGARVGLAEALLLEDDEQVERFLRRHGLPRIAPNAGSFLAFAKTTRAIDLLMAHGAAADVKDRWGSAPIEAMSRMGAGGRLLVQHMIASGVAPAPAEYARMGDRDTLARLTDANPLIARQDAVLMGAVDFRHHELVEWLLECGASANARSDAISRHTALHAAAWNGDLRMAQLLVSAGADPRLRDEQHSGTPLEWALTSIEVSNNPACAEVAAYLESLEPG